MLSVKKPNKVSKTEKLQYLFLAIFWMSVPKICSCRGDWTLGCLLMKCWDFSNNSIHLNWSKMGMLYGRYHVVANTLWNQPNHIQVHIEKLLCGGHFHSRQLLWETIIWHHMKSWENKTVIWFSNGFICHLTDFSTFTVA